MAILWARGKDISTWQDSPSTPARIDWTKPKANGIRFVIHRATFSTALDDDFLYNWAVMKEQGYIRGAYGFWDYRPGNPGPEAQAKALVEALKADPPEFPVVWMDVEQPNSTWPALPLRTSALDQIHRWMDTVEQGLGIPAGIYTRGQHIKYTLAKFSGDYCTEPIPAWLAAKPLWIAAWPQYPDGYTLESFIEHFNWTPNIYGQWARWTLWQYGTPADGKIMGFESAESDADFFNGSEDDLIKFCKGEEQTSMWTNNAIGLYTTKAGWTNPAFDFIVGYAGGNWTQQSPGVMVLEPNVNLKAIEEQAHKEGLPFIPLWDFDIEYYTGAQYMADDVHWPPEPNDYPLQSLIRALSNRAVDGLIIRVMNRKNLAGKDELMQYVAYAARRFVERANRWLYTTKGLDKWCFVLTNDDFLRLDGKQEYFYSWLKNWYLGIEQPAVLPLASGAWPQETDKIRAVPPSQGWRLWYHYNTAALDMMIWNGTDEQMRVFLGATGVDTVPPSVPAGLTGSASGMTVTLAWQPSTDNVGVEGYGIYRDGAYLRSSPTAGATITETAAGSHVYEVDAFDKAGNHSARASVTVIVSAETDGELEQRVAQLESDVADMREVIEHVRNVLKSV